MTQPLNATLPTGAWLGIDVGGTKVRAGLETTAGSILHERTIPSAPFADDFVASMAHFISDIRSAHPQLEVTGVGIGMPGVVRASGEVSHCPAFPNLTEIDVAAAIGRAVELPVVMANDADLAALAEYRFGNYEVRSLASLALGTGVGLGLVVDGHLLYGDHGAAGEIATFPIIHGGKLAELESVVSVAGLLRERGWSDPSRVPELIDAASTGDPQAVTAVSTYCKAASQLIGGLCAVVDPGVVVLTGGLGTRDIVATAIAEAVADLGVDVTLRTSKFHHRAPLLGALALRTESGAAPAGITDHVAALQPAAD